jgi:hypothetical protein
MALNVQGLLSGLAGIPNAIGQGLLGPMPVNQQLGLDPQSLSGSPAVVERSSNGLDGGGSENSRRYADGCDSGRAAWVSG